MQAGQTSLFLAMILLSAFMVASFALLFYMLRRLQKRQAAAVMKRFEGRRLLAISSSANFFGLSSRGLRQLRGNGILALTEDTLFFQLWLSRNCIEIPVKSISGIATPRIFLRKSILRPLLRVDFTSDKGRPDAAAWYVKKLPEWKEALERLMAAKQV